MVTVSSSSEPEPEPSDSDSGASAFGSAIESSSEEIEIVSEMWFGR